MIRDALQTIRVWWTGRWLADLLASLRFGLCVFAAVFVAFAPTAGRWEL